MAGLPDLPDWDALYHRHILPAFAVPGGGQSAPRCIFLCGPQGSGKTTQLQRLRAELGPDVTQAILPDALVACLDVLHGDTPAARAAFDAYRSAPCTDHCQRLADHAVARRAHILWECAIPSNLPSLARAVRRLGYRVECLVLATPAEESWLATLSRTLDARAAGQPTAMHIGWALTDETARRWPVVIEAAETDLTFDRIAILDRDGDACFDNSVTGPPDRRRWSDPPFGFESLMVERARPRDEASLTALLALWDRLHPALAAAGHPAWPARELAAFDRHLRNLVADPATRFDLNDPDPATAGAWIDRLAAALAATEAGPEPASPGLARRGAQLLALVGRIAGQPIR